jgi:indolepyruvate ferredoxin oxidoreductase alpha subunit
MTAMLDAAHYDANITVLIMDNATTAMTGAQDSLATGEQLMEMLKGLGVKDLHMFEPLPKHHAQNVETLKNAIEHQGLSVIVSRRACIHIKPKAKPLPQCKT